MEFHESQAMNEEKNAHIPHPRGSICILRVPRSVGIEKIAMFGISTPNLD